MMPGHAHPAGKAHCFPRGLSFSGTSLQSLPWGDSGAFPVGPGARKGSSVPAESRSPAYRQEGIFLAFPPARSAVGPGNLPGSTPLSGKAFQQPVSTHAALQSRLRDAWKHSLPLPPPGTSRSHGLSRRGCVTWAELGFGNWGLWFDGWWRGGFPNFQGCEWQEVQMTRQWPLPGAEINAAVGGAQGTPEREPGP